MKNLLITLSLLVAFAMGGRANVIFSDSFDYANGILTEVAPTGIWNAHSGSGGMIVTNSQLQLLSSLSEDDNALLAGQPYTTNSASVLYSAFKVKFTALPTAAGAYFAHFRDTNSGAATGFGARVWVALTNSTDHLALPAGSFRIGIGNGISATNISFGEWTNTLVTNVVYKIVTRFVPSTGASTLWVNPNAESDPSVSGTDVGTVIRPDPIDVVSYAFRQNAGEGTMLIDNLKVSTAFNDVAGTNTSPSISPVATKNTPAGIPTTPSIAFTISDEESAATNLTLSGSSANIALVPDANIVFGGTGTNRNVTITPLGTNQGSAVISLSVSDATNVTTTQFTLRVGAPSISPIANQITTSNQAIVVAFTTADNESDPLTITASSSDTSLVPNVNIVPGAGSPPQTLTITPAPGLTGNATITVSVSDGHNTNSTSFVLTVKALYGLVFADDFTYSDGSLFSLSTVWIHATSGSGTSTELRVTNGVAIVSNGLTEDLMANLTNGPFASTNGVVLYCSFTMSNSALPSVSGTYFMHYRDSALGSTFKCKLFPSTTNAAAGFFRLGIASGANVIDAASQFPLDLSSNGTYTVVTRYNVGTGESRLWINPSSESSTSVGASDAASPSAIGAIALREDNGNGSAGSRTIDNLKIGTSFSDVVAGSPALTITKNGTDVILTWSDATYSLQAASLVTGTYTTIPLSTSPYTNAISGSEQYFRLAK